MNPSHESLTFEVIQQRNIDVQIICPELAVIHSRVGM